MKKITRLQINPEQIIKNDELLTLKGGYDGNTRCLRYSPYGGDCEVSPPTCYMADIYCQAVCPGYHAILCVF